MSPSVSSRTVTCVVTTLRSVCNSPWRFITQVIAGQHLVRFAGQKPQHLSRRHRAEASPSSAPSTVTIVSAAKIGDPEGHNADAATAFPRPVVPPARQAFRPAVAFHQCRQATPHEAPPQRPTYPSVEAKQKQEQTRHAAHLRTIFFPNQGFLRWAMAKRLGMALLSTRIGNRVPNPQTLAYTRDAAI